MSNKTIFYENPLYKSKNKVIKNNKHKNINQKDFFQLLVIHNNLRNEQLLKTDKALFIKNLKRIIKKLQNVLSTNKKISIKPINIYTPNLVFNKNKEMIDILNEYKSYFKKNKLKRCYSFKFPKADVIFKYGEIPNKLRSISKSSASSTY